VISIRRISLGGGFRYLMESVAVGDGAPERTNNLARYYAESGTPPGIFLGAGLADVDGGRGIEPGAVVTEDHLFNMLAACVDPVSGEPVGRTPAASPKAAPVAGFDLTFSPPKSVSVAWALADEGTKAVIYECHRRASDYVLSYAERTVFHSRSGTAGVVDEDVNGVVAASFTHWDSRAGDPQLHDHVVVWNRAKSASDERWRTLDSRAIFRSTVALSNLHQGVLADMLTAALGVGWDARSRRHSTRPKFEITGVPDALMAEFSQRSAQVEEAKEELIARFVAAHGRQPTSVEVLRMRQRATLATRPDKCHRSLAEMTGGWRHRAGDHIGDTAVQVAWVTGLKGRNDLPLLRADDLDDGILVDAAEATVAAVAERRSTYGRHNLLAEAARLLDGVRFASPDDRVAVAERIVELATERSVLLTPPSPHHTPARYLRADGTSRLHPARQQRFTTQLLLDAEARLLAASRRTDGPTVSAGVVAEMTERTLPGRIHGLSLDQALAVEKITTSGRMVDVLVGPAGTGKSTTMAGLRAAWEARFGAGSVVGLAPSAAAAEVLADELGIDTENTAKWLTEWRRIPELAVRRDKLAKNFGRHAHPTSLSARKLCQQIAEADRLIGERRLRPGQLVIVDEASLAGTFALDELVAAAGGVGAKVVLVGDWAQLSAVEAGGAFGLLAQDRGDLVPELTDVRRFDASWEKVASVQLRLGREDAIDAYEAEGRVTGGTRDELLDALFAAWKHDIDAGKTSLMIAADATTVAELNRRARADRVVVGEVASDGIAVAAGQVAGVGDEVVTRLNHRLLVAGGRWVKNGDRWVVTATPEDGSLAVRRVGGHGEVVLPADYVTRHVELAYATTAHRAQGRTVDTAHALVSPTTTRKVLYVAATRGRVSNRLYVDVAFDPDPQIGHDEMVPRQDARAVLAAVLANEGADASAHETIRREQHASGSIATLVAEYQTIARVAQADRWDRVLSHSVLTSSELAQMRTSDAYGPLLAALADAEARGLDIEAELPNLATVASLRNAEDVAAVLHERIDQWVAATGKRRHQADDMIAELIPRARGVTDLDLARALDERAEAIEGRARHLAERAVANGAPWVRTLGGPPSQPAEHYQWMQAVATAAAYRERWRIESDPRPLGSPTCPSHEQALDRRRIAVVLRPVAARRVRRDLDGVTDVPSPDDLHAVGDSPEVRL
jgi:conjugative relaxase-like TrwC/TraI family protein